jgi:hypothetical protein
MYNNRETMISFEGWTKEEAIGPLQNSFSDYVKNASLTYI